MPIRPAVLLLLSLLLMQTSIAADPRDDAPAAASRQIDETVRIGVLSHRGEAMTQRAWRPTADYLTSALPGWCFEIVPLDFDAVEPIVAAGAVDFVLVNPAIYVQLEVRHRIARIATMRNGTGALERNVFGGVIFRRADRDDIHDLADLRGHQLMAVDPTSLGGWQRPGPGPERASLRRHP
jgi:two-component system sensor histidine kinase TtrS